MFSLGSPLLKSDPEMVSTSVPLGCPWVAKLSLGELGGTGVPSSLTHSEVRRVVESGMP